MSAPTFFFGLLLFANVVSVGAHLASTGASWLVWLNLIGVIIFGAWLGADT